MFELPECIILAHQINDTLLGKSVICGQLGNTEHKFVFYNRTHEEFEALTQGKTIGLTYAKGRWIFMPVQPGYVLLVGECGGRMLYHPPGENLPKKYHLALGFDDGSSFSITTQMWGFMGLHDEGEEHNQEYVRGMYPTPVEESFTFDYFRSLLEDANRSAKSLLTQDQTIPGLGNAIAQDILFNARIHPKRAIGDLDEDEQRTLYDSIINTVQAVIHQGGRYDETDLFGQKGGYVRLMDKNALDQPCPVCGSHLQKMQYLGGTCYVCPSCQS